MDGASGKIGRHVPRGIVPLERFEQECERCGVGQREDTRRYGPGEKPHWTAMRLQTRISYPLSRVPLSRIAVCGARSAPRDTAN